MVCPFPIKNIRYSSPTRHKTRPSKSSCLKEGCKIRGSTWDERLKCQEAGNRQEMLILSNTEGWGGECVPNKVGSGKLNKCAVLLPQSELVWGKLPQSAISSVRSTAIVEPTQSKSRVTNHQIILCGERVGFPSQIINHK
jgi:hypothetical protein